MGLNVEEEKYPILPKIIYKIDDNYLRPFLDGIKRNYYSCIVSLSHYFDGSFVQEVLFKLDKVFGLQEHEIYQNLLEYIEPGEFIVSPGDENSLNEVNSFLLGKKDEVDGGLISKTTFSEYLLIYLEQKLEETSPIR